MWSGFWVILKITSANSCKPNYDIINYSTPIYPFETGKCGKEGKKLKKNLISRERKELFRWNKKHFSEFLKGYHKNKNLIKNGGHKL